MCEENYDFLDRIMEALILWRTSHRQSVPSCITSSTSSLLNKLRTQRRFFLMTPKTYNLQMQAAKRQNIVLEAIEIDRTIFQEKTMPT